MELKEGSKGNLVVDLQNKLNFFNLKKYGEGKFKKLKADGDFGKNTHDAVVKFQQDNKLPVNGKVDDTIWNLLTGNFTKPFSAPEVDVEKLNTATPVTPSSNPSKPTPTPSSQPRSGDPSAPYKDVIFEGSTFPDKPYDYNVKIVFNKEMTNEYVPALEKALPNAPRGLKLLITIMAFKEGFYKGTRSYTNNNPGNIGNTDSGANKKLATLEEGILLQKKYVEDVVAGKNSAYPMNKAVKIKPYYSSEIAKNQKTYGISPYLPGYNFTFTGQLDQYVKIYSTGARAGNSYINIIISYFKKNGIDISPESKIQDIIKIA